MRILYISRENAPGSHGGAVHTWQVAFQLARRGNRVTLLCNRSPWEKKRESVAGVRVIRHTALVAGKKVPLLLAASLPALRNERFDLIVERFDTFGGLGALMAQATGVPLCLEVNYPHLEEMLWKWRMSGSAAARWKGIHRSLQAWNHWQYKKAAVVIAPRPSIVPRECRKRLKLVHWGADPDHFQPVKQRQMDATALKQRLGLESSRIVISHGSFQPWHGVTLFPDIIRLVAARKRDVVFAFIGRSRDLHRMQNRLEQMGLSAHCRFYGRVAYGALPDYLNAADVALAPFSSSAYEPLLRFGFFWSPAKLFEYMASSLPIVTTDQDYLQQVVQAEGAGICVAQDDPAALAEAVLDLLDQPARCRLMGALGRSALLQRYSWQVHAGLLEGWFKELFAK
jgi:glycosyltransferase involved in cell wall biosynthesis